MTSDPILRLPAYPSTATRKSLSASQLATLNQTVAASLLNTLSLPPSKRDTPFTRTFLSTFAKDAAHQTMQGLIWSSTHTPSKDEELIQKRALLLADKLAQAPDGIDIEILLDLAVVFAATPQRSLIRRVFASAAQSTPSILSTISGSLLPAFTALLSSEHVQGLYALRKAAHAILTFLIVSPPEFHRPFAQDKAFVVALATVYDSGLATIAHSYGGIALLRNAAAAGTPTDDWEPLWVETKVALLDSFHLLFTCLLDDLSSSAPGRPLALEAERTFGVVFALLEVVPSQTDVEATPFLNRPLLADYQSSYTLSKSLEKALKGAEERDVRLDLLESTLSEFDESISTASTTGEGKKDPGTLKILLRSSGIQPGIDNLGTGSARSRQPALSVPSYAPPPPPPSNKGKGKSKSLAPAEDPPDLDIKITQVLDILPHLSSSYIRLLLLHPRFSAEPERVVEAVLEGTAPEEEELVRSAAEGGEEGNQQEEEEDVSAYVRERQNVWDAETMDLERVRMGKKNEDVLKDRSFMEQMKADILRRAEAISDEEDEDEEEGDPFALALGVGHPKDKGKGRGKASADDGVDADLDMEDSPRVKILGDGEDTDESDAEAEDEEEEEEEEKQTPETILELAYIRDPKLFDRDSGTRRSKGRQDLRTQTGWDDPQIEGWRIMLERNPKKDKILQKHEFSGNQTPVASIPSLGPSSRGRGGGRGGGRGRGGSGGRGRGGGGGRGGGSGGGDASARERAWKDKNKASRGNHNRKRGHDKKMARAGAGVPPAV